MGKTIHVLLIDDDPDDQFLFEEALTRLSFPTHCSYYNSGITALEWLGATTELPDYIFLDLNMPRMNGLEVLAEIKGHAHLQHLPVIIYSTSGNEAHKQKAKELGASLYLVKSNTHADFTKALTHVFETIPAANK